METSEQGLDLIQTTYGENLLKNGNFEDWSAGTTSVPDNWVLTGAGATILRDADTDDVCLFVKTIAQTRARAFLDAYLFAYGALVFEPPFLDSLGCGGFLHRFIELDSFAAHWLYSTG